MISFYGPYITQAKEKVMIVSLLISRTPLDYGELNNWNFTSIGTMDPKYGGSILLAYNMSELQDAKAPSLSTRRCKARRADPRYFQTLFILFSTLAGCTSDRMSPDWYWGSNIDSQCEIEPDKRDFAATTCCFHWAAYHVVFTPRTSCKSCIEIWIFL